MPDTDESYALELQINLTHWRHMLGVNRNRLAALEHDIQWISRQINETKRTAHEEGFDLK